MRPNDSSGFSRRTLAKAGLFGAAGAPFLASCGVGAGGEMVLSDEPVRLRLTWWGSDLRTQMTNEAVKLFEQRYRDITVTGEYKEFGAYWDGLATTFAANDAADVLQMDEQYFTSYSDRGALVDLNEGSEFVDLTTMEDDLLVTGQVDGAQFALPVGSGVLAMAVNADLFAQYGVALPDDVNWTWDDYAAVATELTENSNGEIVGSGVTGGNDINSVRYWARSFGSELFGEDGDVALDPELLAAQWQYYLDLMDRGVVTSAQQMVEDTGTSIESGGLATGRTAIGLVHNTQITALRSGSGADMRLLQMPKGDVPEAAYLKPAMYWAVSAGSEHPAEAALLLDFLINDADAAQVLGTERGVPANTEILEQLTPGFAESDKIAADYLENLALGDPLILTPNGGSTAGPILTRVSQQVYFKETSPIEGAEAFIAEVQSEIDATK